MLSDMNHARNSKAAEIVEEYTSSLRELTTNSKPHINMLTILAEDYIDYASAIVEAVEANLQKVQSEVKLPVLYLIDSIIKNVNRTYVNLFAKNIVHTFCHVFEKVDENTRAKLWKLRQTWNDIFPIQQLFSLDVGVHNIDPAWPLSALPANALQSKSIIHVNPKFLQQKVQQPQTGTHRQPEKNATAIVDKQMKEFYRRQKELRALQQTKWKLAYLQRQSQLGRALVHIKPELINPDGTLLKPILTTVPCDVSKLEEKESQPSTADVAPSPSDEVRSSPRPLKNGADTDDVDKDQQQPQQQEQPDSPRGPELGTSDDVPSVSVSPARSVRETVDEALSHSNAEQSGKVELSETPKDNKSIDNEQTTLRSISASDRASDSRPRSPSERSPSKGSSSRSSKPRSSSSSHDKVKTSWSKSSPRKKSLKRSRSPGEGGRHHRHRHRRRHHRRSPGLDEEEQFGGSLIVSPPQPNTVRQRKDSNASRRLKGSSSSRSRSPESGREELPLKRRDSASSSGRDEDLRAELLAATKLETKEDLDLRVLPITSTNKRQSTDFLEEPDAKKSKGEQEFDDLFGKEDVDLRLLQNPPATAKPSSAKLATPPPPCISSSSAKDSGKDSDKDGWARLKMPTASPRSLDSNGRLTSNDRRRGQLRPRMQQQQQYRGRDYNNERNSDRNIEIIMKQAAEQLNQGEITKSQYNKLIQEVLHMSEDQKLRAAQRKEREAKVWERHDGVMRPKEHGMHPRPPGPRWQQPWHQPWAHPPGPFQPHFRPDFRAIGPWQSQPRLFGPMRPPDFHQFHGGFNPRLGPPAIGPNGPLILPNGPGLNPVPMGLVLQNALAKRVPAPTSSGDAAAESWSPGNSACVAGAAEGRAADAQQEVSSSSEDLPAADPELLEEIAKDSMRSINIDNVPREIRYYGHTGVIFMHWDDPRDIGFQNGARRIYIDGQESLVCSFNDDFRDFTHDGEVHRIKLGAPTRELYINDKWYPCYFGGQPIIVDLGSKKVNIKLEGPPPQVKIGLVKRTDLVVGKINLIINARSMVPVFLDAKPQMFELEGMPCTLEFIDSLQTVLLNGRPLKVEFGGLPQPVLAQGTKHFIRFSVLPRGFRAGYVKIANMKGEQPLELPPPQPATASTAEADAKKEQTEQILSTTATASPVEPDSTSQDGAEHPYTSKSDLQLDVLSSVVPSAMAPSSGLSYQAEPVDNRSTASAIRLPLNLNDLFQRLVETGIVSSLTEMKKPEEEEKNEAEIVPVTFNKSETLKIKNPAMVKGLYSGIQCSSCGMRFAPEMATHYSRHLDWHFRQNRKERDSSRKAHSRIWYYDINDWIQFEEIEDLEDRAQSWFETEKQNMETESAAAEELFVETLQPSVPTGIEEDSCCQVCREIFEQFYNDEKEEWHLRPAVNFEGKNFHPLCLEDHKRALEESTAVLEASELNESKINDNIQNENQELKKDLEENVAPNKESMEEDIVTEAINESETISTEIEETIESETEVIHTEVSNELSTDETKHKETILETSEKLMEISEDISENVNVETKVQSALVETKESVASVETELDSEDSAAQSGAIDSTQVAVKSTIDGNVDLESTTSTVLSVQSKIKINITKCLNSPKESKEIKDVKEEEGVLEEENSEPLKPASIKPALRDKNLSVLPPIQRGEELSALCTIS